MIINNKLKQNISVSYAYNFLLQFNITSAIWVLYLAFRGMSLVEIGLLESIYDMCIPFIWPTSRKNRLSNNLWNYSIVIYSSNDVLDVKT